MHSIRGFSPNNVFDNMLMNAVPLGGNAPTTVTYLTSILRPYFSRAEEPYDFWKHVLYVNICHNSSWNITNGIF